METKDVVAIRLEQVPFGVWRAHRGEHLIAEFYNRSDAQQFAASEELLEACRRGLGVVESLGRELGDWDAVDQQAIEAMRAAIARATGEQS
jgi:hypothetical protein